MPKAYLSHLKFHYFEGPILRIALLGFIFDTPPKWKKHKNPYYSMMFHSMGHNNLGILWAIRHNIYLILASSLPRNLVTLLHISLGEWDILCHISKLIDQSFIDLVHHHVVSQ